MTPRRGLSRSRTTAPQDCGILTFAPGGERRLFSESGPLPARYRHVSVPECVFASTSWFGASGNPLLQAASLLVFGLLLVGAFVMGAVIFAIVLAIAAVGAIALYAQLWWLRRKAARSSCRRAARRT